MFPQIPVFCVADHFTGGGGGGGVRICPLSPGEHITCSVTLLNSFLLHPSQ